jgi:hypothetical protein
MDSPFDREACRRLPLADAALRLLDFATDAAFLQGVFARHRGRSYESAIAFPTLVHLVADALLGHRGSSAHQTFQHAQETQALDTTVQALYGKLRRVPLDLSLGLLAEAATRLRSVASEAVAHPLPKAFDAFWTLGFDGKKIKYVAQRLKPLRGLKGEIYGGKLLVVQDLATRQAVAAEAVADGEAGDSPLAPGAVARVRARGGSRPRLWVGDRAFCDYKLLGVLAADADGFVVRFNTACGFHADPDVPPRHGIDDERRPYREEWGWLGGPKHPHRIRVRRIHARWHRLRERDALERSGELSQRIIRSEPVLEATLDLGVQGHRVARNDGIKHAPDKIAIDIAEHLPHLLLVHLAVTERNGLVSD